MAINFPTAPTTNQTYTYNGRTWTYNGVGWQATGASGLSVYTKTGFTATAAQTTFTVAYTLGFVDVYYNGSKLSTTEYTATNGTSVVLGTACSANDIVETIAWTVSTTLNPALGVATATSLAIGGATIGANALAVTGTTNLAGLVTATTGISSTLTTDATSDTTGSIVTAGGISMQKALWVGTTSRHVGAVTMNAALTYGGITLSNAVTGTGNMVLSASPTLTGTLTAAAGTFSSTFGATGAATFGSTIASGAITSTGAVTGTYFTATAAATNGLGLVAANTPALYASTTEFMRSTTSLTTFALATTHTGATTLSAALTYGGITLSNAVTGTGNMCLSASPTLTGTLTAAAITASGQIVTTEATGASSTTTGSIHTAGGLGVVGTSWFGANMKLSKTGSAQFIINGTTEGIVLFQNAGTSLWELTANLTSDYAGIYSYTKGATCLRVDNDGKVNANYALAVGGAATFSSTIASGAITSTGAVTGTLFTPTATGNNGLGLAAANTPAFYASTTEVLRATTSLLTVQLAATLASTLSVANTITLANTNANVFALVGSTNTTLSASGTTAFPAGNQILLHVAETSNTGAAALFLCFRNGSAPFIVTQGGSSVFSNAQGTVNCINVYWNGTALTIENGYSSSRVIVTGAYKIS